MNEEIRLNSNIQTNISELQGKSNEMRKAVLDIGKEAKEKINFRILELGKELELEKVDKRNLSTTRKNKIMELNREINWLNKLNKEISYKLYKNYSLFDSSFESLQEKDVLRINRFSKDILSAISTFARDCKDNNLMEKITNIIGENENSTIIDKEIKKIKNNFNSRILKLKYDQQKKIQKIVNNTWDVNALKGFAKINKNITDMEEFNTGILAKEAAELLRKGRQEHLDDLDMMDKFSKDVEKAKTIAELKKIVEAIEYRIKINEIMKSPDVSYMKVNKDILIPLSEKVATNREVDSKILKPFLQNIKDQEKIIDQFLNKYGGAGGIVSAASEGRISRKDAERYESAIDAIEKLNEKFKRENNV